MRLKTIALSLAALAVMPASLAVAAKDIPRTVAMSPADAALAERAINRGWLMYAYDQAAWHGTDDMAAKMPDYADRVGGWIVEGPANATHLIFYSRDKDNPKAVYVADFRDMKLVSSKVLGASDDTMLTQAQLKLIDARSRAKAAMLAAKVTFCANAAANSIVLPPERPGGPYLVYFMTPQTGSAAVPIGGHFLFEVAVDGRVSGPRPFSKSCLEMPARRTGAKDAQMAFVTSLLDPVPTEVHVFTMIAMRLPLVVGTTQNNMLWSLDLDNGHPRILSMGPISK
jgi:hypothetical protein